MPVRDRRNAGRHHEHERPLSPSSSVVLNCYETVTSMAFRSSIRGLAATAPQVDGSNNPYGVWLFNGTRSFPDPTFPGNGACAGSTVVWAG